MSALKLIIISIISAIFPFGNADSQVGLIKTVARGLRNTVDNAVNVVEYETAGTGMVGNVLMGAGNIAKAAMDGTEKIVSDADDNFGNAAKGVRHSLQQLLELRNETMKDLARILEDTGLGVKGIASNTMWMAQNITGAVRDMMK